MSRLKGFIGGAYTLQSVNIDAQRCVNLFPQITESQDQADGEIGALISAPGKRLLGTCGSGPIRGIYAASSGAVIVVSGSGVYQMTSAGSFTLLGSIGTNSGRVQMADNTGQVIIVDGSSGYILNLATGILNRITSAGFTGANTVTFQDGYFICNNPGTGQFFWSNLYDGNTWDPLNFITAEGSPDNTIAVISNQRQVWVFGSRTVEVFWDSGADTTFSRIDGAFIEYGCASANTPQKFANSLIWLGYGQTGQGVVWQSIGFQAKRVSNHGVEIALQNCTDLSLATSWIYQSDGHAFYVLNHPNLASSWVYDVSTGQWHERCSLGSDGNLARDRAECYAYGFNTHIVGDYSNGNIYALDDTIYQDNGNPLVRMRRAPHLSSDGRRVFFSKFQLMCRVGCGLDGTTQYTNPQAELRYSDDFGHTWSDSQSRGLGPLGNFATRVIWRRLGQSRNRVFEVRISDPVEVAIMGAEIDATVGMT